MVCWMALRLLYEVFMMTLKLCRDDSLMILGMIYDNFMMI